MGTIIIFILMVILVGIFTWLHEYLQTKKYGEISCKNCRFCRGTKYCFRFPPSVAVGLTGGDENVEASYVTKFPEINEHYVCYEHKYAKDKEIKDGKKKTS
jgi:hypothetical protein